MTNHILQLLAKFHRNLMKRFQMMPEKPHFLTLIPYNQKNKTSLSSHYRVTTSCQKSEQSYEQFSSSPPDGRTDGRTHERELIGPNRSEGTKKTSQI